MEESYVIIVFDGQSEKYLFNRRTLVTDIALARKFSGLTTAKRYFCKSCFIKGRYRIESARVPEPFIDPHNPGAFVE